MKNESRMEIKFIFIIIGIILFLFFTGFFVRGCIDENAYNKTSNDYRTTIERLNSQLADENDTIQRIATELQQATEELERFNEFFIDSTKRIEDLKKSNSDDEKRLDIIRKAVEEIKQAVTN